jgi:hypothetical protein
MALNKKGLLVFCFLIVVLTLLALCMSEPRGNTMDGMNKAISYLLRTNPRHPLHKTPVKRAQIAAGLLEHGRRHSIPPYFLLAAAFRESSLRTDVAGLLGEMGILQCHGHCARGCNMRVLSGQLECSVRWLRAKMDECNGSLEGGFLRYATGRRICKPDSEKLRWLVNDRVSLWKQLENLN